MTGSPRFAEQAVTPVPQGSRSFVRRMWFDVPLWRRIVGAMVMGALVGFIWGEGAANIKWIGDIFIRLIRMLVVPLVFATIVSGVAAMVDIKRLGSIGVKTLGLYLTTTLLSAALGLAIGTVLEPGTGVDLAGVVPQDSVSEPISVVQQFIAIIPLNPFEALARGDILAVIFFAILVGAGILAVGEPSRPLVAAFDAGVAVMLKVTYFVMEVAPFGVFALIAWVMGTSGPDAFVHIFLLAVCVLVGCSLQLLLIHGGLVRLLAGLPIVPFFRDITDVIIVAFSTSSSSATLPIAMHVAEQNLGVSPVVASTSLPIGTTISMDGTALYVGLLTMFSAQIFGVDLSFVDYLTVIAVTGLVAIGSAPIPSASLFLLAGVLQVIGVSVEQTAIVVGFILPFDRILDMMRTVPNCTGDLSVAVVVARWEGELDEVVYLQRPVE